MDELNAIAVLGEDLPVEHDAEGRAVGALQILVNKGSNFASGAAFDEALRPAHILTGVSSTKVSRVSDGTFTRWPLVTASAPAPAAPPATPPIAAPLPPPAMAPMIAPTAAVPP